MTARLNPKIVVCIVYVVAMFMISMDATIVNVALRTISNEFQVPPSATGTINVGYLVGIAVFLPVAGWLGDRWGSKRVLLAALGIFTAASALCGLAHSTTSLTFFRVLQGAGGGLLTPVGMAMLFRIFSPHERRKLSRVLVIPIALAPAIGPVIGGFLVDQLSWRWAFYMNLPLGCVTLLFGLIYLREHMESDTGPLDLPGFLLSASGFAMLVYALSQGAVQGWNSPGILSAGLGGLVIIVTFIIVEKRVSRPMLDLRLLHDRLFRNMGLISSCSTAGLLGMLYVFPLMYQDALHASALDTGLTTFPEALGLMLASQIMPWSYSRLGPRRLISIALLCTAILFVLLSLIRPETSAWYLRMVLFSAGFFLGHAVGAVQVGAFANISSHSMGQASTLFHVQNRIGSALGVAILASLLAITYSGSSGAADSGYINLGGYRVAMLGAAAFLIAAFFFALRIRDADAASTMLKGAPSRASEPRPATAKESDLPS